jgi:hypothetical protein
MWAFFLLSRNAGMRHAPRDSNPVVRRRPQGAGQRIAPRTRALRSIHEAGRCGRAEAREKDRRADQLECSAWNAIMFCGGPAQPSPTIDTALNAGYDQLEVRCNRCGRLSRADLRKVRRPGNKSLHLLEAALFCQDCSQSKKWKQRAHIVGLASDAPPDAEPPKRALPRGSR